MLAYSQGLKRDAITRNGAGRQDFLRSLTELLTPAFINNKT
jgi:hypothetical protein